jgi:hypothetical protein
MTCSYWITQRASKQVNLFDSSNADTRGKARGQGKERLSFCKGILS